ncbi:nonspecific lipid-transfer protein [Musa troglodytarum]|uniref:Nonspecific lipid-transfer protein n=1 Tax=Musa troglodytarum TaxID=320322 RepID=A0A9E7F5N7_9LILI|nr:nonspecific lipid-transfer protein [Musa troglodytarum]
MKPSSVVFFCIMVSALLLLRTPTAAESATCDPTLLKPCAAAFLFSTRPSSLCCSRIKSQVPCYCQYLNDPSLSGYANGGKKVAAACGVSLPSC